MSFPAPRTPRLLATAGCIVAAIVAAAPAPSITSPTTRLVFQPLAFETVDGGMIEAEVATLKVPERHRASQASDDAIGGRAPRISLRVVRFASTGPIAGPPIVILEGGPGGSAIEAARGVIFHLVQRLRVHGDVIVADQRGTGASVPDLDCNRSANQATGELLTIDSWLQAIRSPAVRCARAWRNAGVDLGAFNSRESANDIEALREGLGVERIALWGVSYGTQLALTYLRQFPDRVERAALHGVLPPDGFPMLPKHRDAVLKRLARLARQADPVNYPDLAGSLRTILADLAVNRRDVSVTDPSTGSPITVRFGDYELQYLLSLFILGNRTLMELLPSWIVAMENGDFSAPALLGLELRRWHTSAMTMAVVCSTGESPARVRKAAKQAPRTVTGAQPSVTEACEPWEVQPLGGDTLDPVRSDVPVLLIAGTLDGTTPIPDAKAVGRRLSNSHLLQLVGATHSDLVVGHPDILEVLDEFMAGNEPSRSRITLGWEFAPPAAAR